MNSLFHPEYETYTKEANDISTEFSELISPFVKSLCRKYKIRELEIILKDELHMILLFESMNKTERIRKAKKNELFSLTEVDFMDIIVSSYDVTNESKTIRQCIDDNDKIAAIKILRKITNCGLKDAKDFLDRYFVGV